MWEWRLHSLEEVVSLSECEKGLSMLTPQEDVAVVLVPRAHNWNTHSALRRRFLNILAVAIAVVAISNWTCAAAAKKVSTKQATPAQGNSSDQPVPVSTPFCDAYLPYQFDAGSGRIVQEFPPTALKYPVDSLGLQDFLNRADIDTFIDSFLQKKWSTLDPVSADGSLHDPGYPLLGNPQKHLYANGNDLSRILTRLSYSTDPRLVPASLCLGIPPTPSKGGHPDIGSGSRNGYYLVHIVRWKRTDGQYVTSSSDWYLFNSSDGKAAHRQVPFRFHPVVTGDLRIFGSNKVLFLAIHLGPLEDPDFAKQVNISYKLAAKNIEPANIQDLKALIGVVTGSAGQPQAAEKATSRDNYKQFLKSSLRRTTVGLYGAAKLTNLQRLPVQITATMQAKLPKADSALPDEDVYKDDSLSQDQISQEQAKPAASGSGDNQGTTGNAASGSGGSATSSSQKTAGQSKGCSTTDDKGTCSENVVVQNEGLYLWDVSIGVPFTGVKQLQYSYGSNGQVTPQTVSKANAYGFVVLSPWKEDIVSPPSLGIPHLMAGLPLKGKVFDAPFFGAGETFNASKLPAIGTGLAKVIPISIRLYAGIVYNKQFGPVTSASVAPPSHRVAKLQYGIEFSVKDIASKLSGKSSNSSKPTTSSKK